MTGRRSKESRVVRGGVAVAQGDSDVYWQHSVLTQCGMPRRRTDAATWQRSNGQASLLMRAGDLWDGVQWVPQPLPYGTYPRLFSIYIASQVIRTGAREVDIGDSTREMLRRLGKGGQGGAQGPLTQFRRQAKALAAASVKLGIPGRDGGGRTVNAQPIQEFEAWLADEEGQSVLWPGTLVVSEDFRATVGEHAVPLHTEAVRALQGSSLELDLYQWLAQRLHRIPRSRPLHLSWAQVRDELAPEYQRAAQFRDKANKALRSVLTVYPSASVELDVDGSGLVLRHSAPPVAYNYLTRG